MLSETTHIFFSCTFSSSSQSLIFKLFTCASTISFPLAIFISDKNTAITGSNTHNPVSERTIVR